MPYIITVDQADKTKFMIVEKIKSKLIIRRKGLGYKEAKNLVRTNTVEEVAEEE